MLLDPYRPIRDAAGGRNQVTGLPARPPCWPVTIATVALAVTILCHRAWTTGLQCDELLFLRAVELGPVGGLMAAGSSHPPLLRWLLAPLGGQASPDWLVRLPSILTSATSIVVWGAILRRMIPDRPTAWLLLPAMALGGTFLAQGYQCTPYALLMLLASLHGLCWFWLLELRGRLPGVLFVLSGVLAAWTHFYGIHLLVADQLIWGILVHRGVVSGRAWFAATLTSVVLVLPLVPIAAFYLHNDQPYPILQISDYPTYFLAASAWIFFETTFFGIPIMVPFYVLWYLAALVLFGKAWGGGGDSGEGERPQAFRPGQTAALAAAAVACGVFLAGFPATQLHSVISGKSMWARYTAAGIWIHWPMVVMLIYGAYGPKAARTMAAGVLTAGVIAFVPLSPSHTVDYRPVVACVRARGQSQDAFFAQDMDMWVGASNFDRLWFQRYLRMEMPIISGPMMRRRDLYAKGLPLEAVDGSVDRIWVYSHLFGKEWLRAMPTHGWKLQELHTFERNYPLALFVRL